MPVRFAAISAKLGAHLLKSISPEMPGQRLSGADWNVEGAGEVLVGGEWTRMRWWPVKLMKLTVDYLGWPCA